MESTQTNDLTMAETAIQSGYSIQYLYASLRVQKLPGAYRFEDGTWRIPQSTVDLLRQRKSSRRKQ